PETQPRGPSESSAHCTGAVAGVRAASTRPRPHGTRPRRARAVPPPASWSPEHLPPRPRTPTSTHSPPWSLLRRDFRHVTPSMEPPPFMPESSLPEDCHERAERDRAESEPWPVRVLGVPHGHTLDEPVPR